MGHQQQHVQGVVVVEHGAVHLEHADIADIQLYFGIYRGYLLSYILW